MLRSELKNIFLKHDSKIKNWLESHSQKVELPLYSSVDLRDAGYKLAPIDHNVFAAGFNNLSQSAQKKASEFFRKEIEKYKKDVKKIALIPENHTSNKRYLDNVFIIKKILNEAGFDVFIATLASLPSTRIELDTFSFGKIELFQANIKNHVLEVDNQKVDFVLVNNDFSDALDERLLSLHEPVCPNPRLGWFQRRKSQYLQCYHRLMREFSTMLNIDPWLFSTYVERVQNVDFRSGEGLANVAQKVAGVLNLLKLKYSEYGIERRPFVFIKNNSGTYGMGILTVYDGEEVLHLSRKQKQEMFYGKSKKPITDIIIQEGVPASQMIGDCIGEPVLYLVDKSLVGGFIRVNCGKSDEENLNVKGGTFKPVDFKDEIYEVISQISTLAVGYEGEFYT